MLVNATMARGVGKVGEAKIQPELFFSQPYFVARLASMESLLLTGSFGLAKLSRVQLI